MGNKCVPVLDISEHRLLSTAAARSGIHGTRPFCPSPGEGKLFAFN